MTHNPDTNRQAGLPLQGGQSIPAEEVGGGDRPGEARYVPDPEQLVRVEFTHEPPGPLPPEEQNTQAGEIMDSQPETPIQDVSAAPPEPSVWDARPLPPNGSRGRES